MITIRSVECTYNNLYINLKPTLTEHTKNDLRSYSLKEISTNGIVKMNCDQNYVECLKANATIPNFENSDENFIQVVVKFKILKNAIGNFITFKNFELNLIF